jgi:hypothetical protein
LFIIRHGGQSPYSQEVTDVSTANLNIEPGNVKLLNSTLIHHQSVICCVTFSRFSLRRTVCTPQSALLRCLASNTLLVPRVFKNTPSSLTKKNLMVDFGHLYDLIPF